LENNSRQPLNLTKNGQSDSPNKSQLTVSHRVDEGRVVVDEEDNECEPIKLVTSPSDRDSGY
jgi:hypothetical protein